MQKNIDNTQLSPFGKRKGFIRLLSFSLILLFGLFGLAKHSWAATYYIDFPNGSNSYDGTEKVHTTGVTGPWKSHPYMRSESGCSGTGSVPTYTHSSGDRFIFKGGETWPSDCWPLDIAGSGTSGTYDYYGPGVVGIDAGVPWGSGKPIWDAEWTIPGHQIVDHNDYFYFYGAMVRIASRSYINVDNIEIRNLQAKLYSDGQTNSPYSVMFLTDTVSYIKWTYVYGHGWAPASGATIDGQYGFLWPGCGEGCVFDHGVISNAEETGTGLSGMAFRSVDTISNSTIHDVSIVTVGARLVHDNVFYNINHPTKSVGGSYSRNLLFEITDSTAPSYVYNNLIYSSDPTTSPLYPIFCWSNSEDSQYLFNNVVIGADTLETGFMDTGQGTDAIPPQQNPDFCGHLYVFNNTYQTNSNNYWIRISGKNGGDGHLKRLNSVTILNMHIINVNGSDNGCDSPACGEGAGLFVAPQTFNYNPTNQKFQATAAANEQGYTVPNYAAPRRSDGITVDTGTDITAQNWYAALPIKIKTAISKDIRGNPRGQGSAWDVGAYEYVDTTLPAPPTGLMVK